MKTIEFKIIYAKNEQIYQEGYVEIPDDEEEDIEWYYYDSQGFAIPREYTHCDDDEIGLARFDNLVHYDLVDWVQEVIIFSDENENETYARENLIIQINDGGYPYKCVFCDENDICLMFDGC